MSLYIEDTARNNLAAWALAGKAAGVVGAVVVSPFFTPMAPTRSGVKSPMPNVRRILTQLSEAGIQTYVSPDTHVLQMPGTPTLQHYSGWPLWPAEPGRLRTEAERREHVALVFEVQEELGVPHVAPTVLLHAPQSSQSEVALELATTAADLDPNCILAIAGDPGFWRGGPGLDAHVGALAQLEPSGWWLTPVKAVGELPVLAEPEEVHGLCRTSRALSSLAPVHISHGDLFALPALAAGAKTYGTGWDRKQRACAYDHYQVADSPGGGGSWMQRPTVKGLLGLLKEREWRLLDETDKALARRVLPGSLAPGPRAAWDHHARVLFELAQELDAPSEDACRSLDRLYNEARADWALAARTGAVNDRGELAVAPLQEGLRAFMQSEGFL